MSYSSEDEDPLEVEEEVGICQVQCPNKEGEGVVSTKCTNWATQNLKTQI